MTKDQEAYIKASIARAQFLLNYSTTVNPLPGFTSYFGIIQTTNSQAQIVMVQQEAKKKNRTSNKDSLRATLILQTMDFIHKGASLAMNTNNAALQESLNYTESNLTKSSDTKLSNQSQVVYDIIKANVSALQAYGVTDATLVSLQNTIKSFASAVTKLRLDRADKTAATKQLKSLVDTLKLNWSKVDVLLEMVKNTQPTFYEEYCLTKKVIVTGNSPLSMKIRVVNAQTGKPESGAKVTIVAADETTRIAKVASAKEVVIKKTADAGNSHVKGLADGVYLVTVEKPGKNSVSKTASVSGNKYTLVEFEL